mgnify:CR=1 FL=1
MSELHKFIFDGLPVRGIVVRLTDTWTEILRRRASNSEHGAYAAPPGYGYPPAAPSGYDDRRQPAAGGYPVAA